MFLIITQQQKPLQINEKQITEGKNLLIVQPHFSSAIISCINIDNNEDNKYLSSSYK